MQRAYGTIHILLQDSQENPPHSASSHLRHLVYNQELTACNASSAVWGPIHCFPFPLERKPENDRLWAITAPIMGVPLASPFRGTSGSPTNCVSCQLEEHQAPPIRAGYPVIMPIVLLFILFTVPVILLFTLPTLFG